MARRRSTYYTDESWGYERTSPIRTDQGIKSRSQRGNFAASWWADRWIKALERLVDAGRLSRGRSYARKGQVLEIKEKKGQIEAKVQGSRPTPYKVTIRLDPLTDAQWKGVFAALAAQAIFSAQLLNGEMPQTIEEVFAAAGVSLFPTQSGELHTDCSCPDWANPCKHVAAVHYILGEQFDEDPFLLFVLRGRTQEQVLAALRAQRRVEAGAGALAETPLNTRQRQHRRLWTRSWSNTGIGTKAWSISRFSSSRLRRRCRCSNAWASPLSWPALWSRCWGQRILP